MEFVEILKVIVLGIVEGFTEWLPISSTGHMILVDEIIQLNVSDEFRSLFLVIIQLGAVMAVVFQFFRKLNPFDPRKREEQKAATWILWIKIAIACVPAAIIGFFIDDWVDKYLYNGFVVALTLIIYGILFIVVENANKYKVPKINKLGEISYQTAFYIGLFQVLAFIPGTSRSGATILGGLILGASRAVAAEFSFFLSIPVMAGASFLKIVKYQGSISFAEIMYLIIGCVVAFLASLYAIKFLIKYIKNNSFKFFGYYRIVLGAIVLIWYVVSSLING